MPVQRVMGPGGKVGYRWGTTGAGSPFAANTGIFYQNLNSNDGFTIYTGAGTISGTIRIYGYRN